MSKITLNPVGSLIDATTAANTINANSVTVQNAMDNTLSRDGTQPNQMLATLDMNSNRIINLAAPVSSSEPARLQDLANIAAGGTVTLNNVPTGGATGAVLTKNSITNYDMSWITPTPFTFTLGSTVVTGGSTITTVAGAITWSGVQTFSSTPVFSTGATFSGNTAFNGATTTFPNAVKLTSNGILSGVAAVPLVVGSGPGSGDDSAVLVTRTFTPASGLFNSHAFRDESVLTEAVTGGAFSGYASFDSAFQMNGTCTTPMNHVHGFQARQIFNASGHCQEWAGFTAQPTVTNAAGIIDNAYGFFMLNSNIGAGGVTNQYAYYANPLSGAINSYFLYQGAPGNPSVLTGNLYVGGLTAQLAVERFNVQYSGVSQQGLLINDTNAGTGSAALFFRASAQVGSISTSAGATAYNTTSDERLKDFIGKYDPKEAIRIIKADPVRDFKWKSDGVHGIGWGAQTSYSIDENLATPGDTWGVDKGARTPYLWAAMSDVLERLEALESKI
jgi:hypothetical protein